ncbi:MAG: HNH endonuclease [Marinospirillum sp.]|uniref:hypothetical protein n=1 Tax=Marinospirillum sp. TaxID=2183934 RepID=UPI0019EFF9A7|nr:hypothetical protein [Marinospirillum sp.]MBE0506584.1 HNH endonuclease [Marinospirillum sp.]
MSEEIKLLLGVSPPGLSRLENSQLEKCEAEFQRMRPRILERDNWTCQFCGYYSVRHLFQEVHHKDCDHRNNKESNLVTACHFCHMTHHLWYALQCGAVLVAWDFPQVAISRMARAQTQLQKRYPGSAEIHALLSEGKERARSILTDEVYSSLPMQMQYILRESPEDYEDLRRELYSNGIRLAFPVDEYNKSPQLKKNTALPALSMHANAQIIEANEPAWSNRVLNTTLERNLYLRYVKI